MKAKMLTFEAFFLYSLLFSSLASAVEIPDFSSFIFESWGDITLASLQDISDFSPDQFCSSHISEQNVRRAEGVMHAVAKINRDQNILPNLTLGIVVCDSCKKDITALACIVRIQNKGQQCEIVSNQGQHGNSSANVSNLIDESAGAEIQSPARSSVVGVQGPSYSRQSIMVAGYLSLFKAPVLSPFASSDDLADVGKFPYFARLILPDMYQTDVLVDLVSYFGWSYISLIYSEGTYGENAARRIITLVNKRGICLAVTQMLPNTAGPSDYTRTVADLAANSKAKAVILFAESFHMEKIYRAVYEAELSGQFLWLACESFPFMSSVAGTEPIYIAASTTLYVGVPLGEVDGFVEYYSQLTPWDNPDHPWLKELWEQHFQCSWENNDCQKYKSLVDASNTDLVPRLYSKEVDCIYVYGHALHNLITDHCPSAFLTTVIPSDCITGSLLFDYVKNVSIKGFSEKLISFDKKGDILGAYDVNQLIYKDQIRKRHFLGKWSRLDSKVDIDMKAIIWPGATPENNQVPMSKCSVPCGEREYPVYGDVRCCWICQPCRSNEILNGSLCQPCEQFFWPHQSVCEAIPPVYMSLSLGEWTATALAGLATVTGVLGVGLAITYFMARQHKLIKATGRELSSVILAGAILSTLAVFSQLVAPSNEICLLRVCSFHLVIHIMYSPLFLKTVRIYRIFVGGKKGKSAIRFISSKALLMALGFTVLAECIAVLVAELLWPSKATLAMPLPGERYVELYCAQPLPGFILPLVLNLILVLACALLGFLARKLPTNFNESWYIFVSVSTTLFMWVVFLPTYFSAFYASHKAALLALCLVLNSAITLFCQFAPKIYAVRFIDVEKMQVKTIQTISSQLQPSTTDS